MRTDIRDHLSHYIVLALLLMTGIGAFVVFNYNGQAQQWITAGLATGYVLWGITHHQLTDKVVLKIVLEYALVAALGFLIINSLIIQR